MSGTVAGAEKRAMRERRCLSINLLQPQVVACGIDTLHLHTDAPLNPTQVAYLEAMKAEAVAARDGGTAPPTVHLGRDAEIGLAGLTFMVAPHGTGKGALLLTSDDATLIIAPAAPINLPTVLIELRSLYLWGVGHLAAVDQLRACVRELTLCERLLELSRLDLAVDFTGWPLEPSMRQAFSCRAQRRAELHEEWRRSGGRTKVVKAFRKAVASGDAHAGQVLDRLLACDELTTGTYFSGSHFTGFSWGAGAVVARAYDKTREIKKSGKEWFEEIWKRRGWRKGQQVWRLEFQLRRELLKEAVSSEEIVHGEVREHRWVSKVAVETPPGAEGRRTVTPLQVFRRWETAQHQLDGLWEYLSRHWLALKLPRTATQRNRLHPMWRTLRRQVHFGTASGAPVWRAKIENDKLRTLGQGAGYLARGLAERWVQVEGIEDQKLDADAAVNAWVKEVRDYARRHRGDVVERGLERWAAMKARAKLYGTASA